MAPSLRWDVFCRVVDNLGDAGVCWRLARQLAREHGLAVTLWIDDLASLARIVPDLDASAADQPAQGLRVRQLNGTTPGDASPADVVIEGFGCGLPDDYISAMAAAERAPIWIVLEYLSAEPWIEASQALPSPHPRLPLQRWFWFPGFTARTGGVLRERGLVETRRAFRRDPAAGEAAWRSVEAVSPAQALRVSLFCYTNRALPALLECWAQGDEPVACIVPEGVASTALEHVAGGRPALPGRPLVHGRLTLTTAGYCAQDEFDRRLWTANLNFVRGEDSFVRAQWAARPLVWQAYRQADDLHLAKMDAFLTRYEAGLPRPARQAQRAFWYAWNAEAAEGVVAAWPEFRNALAPLASHADAWAETLAAQPDLAEGLVSFCENRL